MSGQSMVDRVQAAIHTIDGSEMAKTVCKASTHQLDGPKPKHLQTLVNMTKSPNINQPELINLIVMRTKEKSWIVVLKALATCHHLIIYGHEKVFQVLAAKSVLFTLEQFNDTSVNQGYAMSEVIRRYSKYLNARAAAYRMMAADFGKMKHGKKGPWTKMDDDKLLKNIGLLQDLLQTLVGSGPPNILNNVARSAYKLMNKDLSVLYATYNDAMICIMERFFSFKLVDARTALRLFQNFIDQNGGCAKFFNAEISGPSIDMDIEKPKSLLPLFQKHVEEMESGKAVPNDKQRSVHNSPKSLSILSPKNKADIEKAALEEEAAALAGFNNKNKQNQKPVLQNSPQKQKVEEKAFSNDLINLGDIFSSNTNNQKSLPDDNINTQYDNPFDIGNGKLNQFDGGMGQVDLFNNQTVTQQQPDLFKTQQNNFDPFSTSTQDQIAAIPNNNPFDKVPLQNNSDQTFNQQQNFGNSFDLLSGNNTGNNPFDNPFSIGNQNPFGQQVSTQPFTQTNQPFSQPVSNPPLTLSYPQQIPLANYTDPFAQLNMGQHNSIPLQQPAIPNNLNQNIFDVPQTNAINSVNNQKDLFGPSLDSTLTNIMSNFSVGTGTIPKDQKNNPFA